jgi:hypothetical protein
MMSLYCRRAASSSSRVERTGLLVTARNSLCELKSLLNSMKTFLECEGYANDSQFALQATN